MLQIVLGLIAIGITFFLWERFKGFKYLLLALLLTLVALVVAFIGYYKYVSYQEDRQVKLKAEMRIDFKRRHPEYDFPCLPNASTEKYAPIPEACLPDWDNVLIDQALEAEKNSKPLPHPIKPRD